MTAPALPIPAVPTAPAAPPEESRRALDASASPAAPARPQPAAPSPATPPVPATRKGLSQNPEAVRARNRRAARKGLPAAPPPSVAAASPRVMTPAAMRPAVPASGPGAPAPGPQLVLTPEQRTDGEANVAGLIRTAGIILAGWFGPDMLVPDRDAERTARLCVEGWPQLALNFDADFKKLLAGGAVVGLAVERYQKVRAARRGNAPAAPAPEALDAPAAPAPLAPVDGDLRTRPSGFRRA